MNENKMKIGEMAEYNHVSINLIENTLIQKKKQVKMQIHQLEIRLGAIARTIESVERFRTAPSRGMITIEYIPHRKIYAMHTDVNFYDYDISIFVDDDFPDKVSQPWN